VNEQKGSITVKKTIALARVVVLESFRRKDPYVVLILGFVITLGAGLFARYGVAGLEKFVKDVSFTAVNVFTSVLCVVAAARQIPMEVQNRTLYPLIAKPVSRATVLFGKYFGVGVLSSAVVLFFALELLVLFWWLGIAIEPIFFQALYLRILSMWLIAALVIFMSLILTHAANVTISLMMVLAMNIFANTILTVHSELQGIPRKVAEVIYWVTPHLELFDLSKKVVHEWPPVPTWVLLSLTVYACFYSACFIGLGIYRFRKMSL